MKGNLKDRITAKVSKKTSNLKDRIKGGVDRKVGRACVALALLATLGGCHMGEQPTAQRAQTSTITDNQIDIRVFAPTNAVYDAEGNPVAAVRIEIGNLSQANETSGTETMTASPSNTPTVSTPIRIDARYNDALAAANATSKNVLGSIGEGLGAVLDLMVSKKSGSVEVTKKDGTTATVNCEGGQCSFAGGSGR